MQILKQIFTIASKLENGSTVYDCEPDDFEERKIRVDTPIGSFYIVYSEYDENYSNAKDEWVVEHKKSWSFTSLHELYEGFNPIEPRKALQYLKTLQ